jgi:hypothetical protein
MDVLRDLFVVCLPMPFLACSEGQRDMRPWMPEKSGQNSVTLSCQLLTIP